MAAAIILIPEMLSGPDRETSDPEERSEAAAPRADSSLKTYTIDLSQSPGARASAQTVDSRVPPPEQQPEVRPNPEQTAPTTQAIPEPPSQQQATAPAVVERPAASTDHTADSPRPAPRPLAPAAHAPTSAAWAVQLGSFSKQATAERLVKELRAKGHSAFVMPVQSDAATLYRVRIGPMKDKASAEAVLQDVKATAPGAAVVTHR
jgi:DedD protein